VALQNLLSSLDVRAVEQMYEYESGTTLLFYSERALERDKDLYKKAAKDASIRKEWMHWSNSDRPRKKSVLGL
jgi:hypothetical protein